MTRRKAVDRILLVVLVGTWATVYARGLGEGLRTQRGFIDIFTSSALVDDYPSVHSSPVGVSAFLPGDRLLAVDGHDLRGASSIEFYDRATRSARERGAAIVRGERGGASFDVLVPLTPRKGWWLSFVAHAVSMTVAVTLFLRAPEWHLARPMFVVLWCWALASALMDGQGGPRGTLGELTLFAGVTSIFATLCIWITQEFTLSARPVPRTWRAVAVLGGLVVISVALVRNFVPHTRPLAIAMVGVQQALVVAATLAGLSRAYLRAAPLERRQLRWVVFGFYVAFLVGGVAPLLAIFGARISGRVLAALASVAVPVGILISVLGYRWLDIDRLISAAAAYSIAGVAAFGAALAVAPRVAAAAAPALGLDPDAAQWLINLTLSGAAAFAAHRYLRPQLDRRIFAERHRRVSGFEELVEDVGRCRGAEELWTLASERIDALIEPEYLVAYAREGNCFEPRFARGSVAPPSHAADSLLVRALERRGMPLAADSSELDPFDRAALETLGVALVMPIGTHESLLGFACLGRKRSGDIYTREEIAQLAAVALRCAQVLRPAPEPLPSLPSVFRREGELWTLASNGKEVRLRDMRGLHYLAVLLREPGREFAVNDLVGAANGVAVGPGSRDPELHTVSRLGDAGPVLDAQARTAYRDRMADLDAELADAERCADLGRAERASDEREALLAELESASRGKRAGSDSERARTAVTKAIKVALEKIAERHPELGAHLSATVRRGYACAYEPDPRVPIEWEL